MLADAHHETPALVLGELLSDAAALNVFSSLGTDCAVSRGRSDFCADRELRALVVGTRLTAAETVGTNETRVEKEARALNDND